MQLSTALLKAVLAHRYLVIHKASFLNILKPKILKVPSAPAPGRKLIAAQACGEKCIPLLACLVHADALKDEPLRVARLQGTDFKDLQREDCSEL